MNLIPPEVKEMVGSTVATATEVVSRREWQRWASAVGDLNPLWFDSDFAQQHGYKDVTCPPLYIQYTVLGVTELGDLREDGSSGAISGNLSFPNAPKRMAGGESTTFGVPVYHGDQIRMERVVESIEQKEGRSGTFVLVTWRTTYHNQDGDLAAETLTSMIAKP